jgi:hypothetical protein
MIFSIKRYSLDKEFISIGNLTIASEEQRTNLRFSDNSIEVTASELYHPLTALESLRRTLEKEYSSIIACNGCRCDTSYRPTGGFGTYRTFLGQQATEWLNIFEPTNEIDKLCTVDQHKAAYTEWLNSLDNHRTSR